MNTYRVIPYRYLVGPGGRKASVYGACPPGYFPTTNGYTVEVTDHNGRVTTGLNSLKTPANHFEATSAAIHAASATNGEFIKS